MEYTMEKGVPIPPRVRKGGKRSGLADDLRRMEVGDSVMLTTDKKYSVLGNTLLRLRKEGMSFTLRNVEGGQRVWRVA